MKQQISHVPVRVVICMLIICGGCNSTQSVTLSTPEKRDTLLTSCQNVVVGTLVEASIKADKTAGEALSIGGEPAHPEKGYKRDYSIRVEFVLKGSFADSVLNLHDVKDPEHTDMFYPKLKIALGRKVYVGWNKESGGTYEGLTIVNAGDVDPTTSP